METITYEKISSTQTAVYLPGPGKRKKRVGIIFTRHKGPGHKFDGYQYVPLGKKRGGEVFATIDLCKRSLEEEPPTDADRSAEVSDMIHTRKMRRAGVRCCELDTDGDGNCPTHSAPGVLRRAKQIKKPLMSEQQALRYLGKHAKYYQHGFPLPGGKFGGRYAVELDGRVFHADDTRALCLQLQWKEATTDARYSPGIEKGNLSTAEFFGLKKNQK